MIQFSCGGCGAKFKASRSKAGVKGTCPRCGTAIEVPHVHADDDDGLYAREALADARHDVPMPAPHADPNADAAPAAGGRRCPSCDQPLGDKAKLCVRCGIKVPSGRPLVTAFEPDLDLIYMRAERFVPWLSWPVWMGLYPIASEGGGGKRPVTTWAIVLVTVLASAAFFVATIRGTADRNLLLWDNDAMTVEQFVDDLADDGVSAARRADVVETLSARTGSFRPSQLLTHAFLHGGLLHLAGNMLFLIVFGSRVNSLIGNLPTLAIYPVLAVVAGWSHMAAVTGGPPIGMLGASGAVMGLCGMYLILFPLQRVHLTAWARPWPFLLTVGFFFWGWLAFCFRLYHKTFTLPGLVAVGGYIAWDVFYVATRLESNVAHWAHLGGFLAGVAVALVLLMTRLIPPGANLLSIVLGRYAWPLVGRPRAVGGAR